MKRISHIAMKIFVVLGIAVFCLIIWFIAVTTWKMPLHNYQLWILQKHFRLTMRPIHPPQSELRTEVAEFGNLGNSNHCDYLVGEFRSSVLSKEELKRVYAETAILSFDKVSRLLVEVYFTDEDVFERDYLWSGWLSKYLPNQPYAPEGNTYLVFASSDLNPPDGDIRCH